ncbi:MAG: type II toxin-antitoxin system HicA family toxin [Peptococcaceae bacterium]|jgi:predicted RNA binding protein YcfA (HicA-like mRNA interferase family)|nr:type II toxin-antitoxin system HicA family toxin [Peptococcaceae bacterium]
MNAYKTTIKLLVSNGYILKRRGGNHDIFFNPRSKITIPVKRHDFDEDDMRYILKEAGIKLINQ